MNQEASAHKVDGQLAKKHLNQVWCTLCTRVTGMFLLCFEHVHNKLPCK